MRRRLTIATAEDNIPDDVEDLPPLDDGWLTLYEYRFELRSLSEVGSKYFQSFDGWNYFEQFLYDIFLGYILY